MSGKFKFIHMADLHLGSILHIGKKANAALADIFNKAVYNSFKNLCDIAIEQKVNFILISGDIYDREARSVKGNSFFIEQCKRLEERGISVYAIAGNHDPLKNNSELFSLPLNVKLFSSEKAEVVDVKDNEGSLLARIVGQSYKENWDSRKMYEGYLLPKGEAINIAMLHTQLDNSNNYVPCSVADLKAIESIDYWALGHIHKHKILNKAEPFIGYPGIPQGRDLGEEGLGGGLLVEVGDNKINSFKLLPSAEVLWRRIVIDISQENDFDMKNIGDLENLMMIKAEEILNEEVYSDFLKGYVFHWTLTGRGDVYSLLRDREEEVSEYLIDNINSKLLKKNKFIYSNGIELKIRRPIENLETLARDNNALTEISKVTSSIFEDEEIKYQLIKRLGSLWEITDSYEDINEKKLQLDGDLLREILLEAEQLAFDAILERSEEL
jgi:DNA repair exonuclease SbcCD nuclease subunit